MGEGAGGGKGATKAISDHISLSASCNIQSFATSVSFSDRVRGPDKSSRGETASVSDQSCSAEVDAHKGRRRKNTGVRRVREKGRCTAGGWRERENKREPGRIDEHESVRGR